MKTLILLAVLLCTSVSYSQAVKFGAKTFDNGFRYPVAMVQGEPAVQSSMNAIITSRIEDLKSSDFCIGDFGYIQKGNHLELHLVCNCIDMETADHRYIVFDLITGEEVPLTDIFDPKRIESAESIITARVKEKLDGHACKDQWGEMNDEHLHLDQMHLRMAKDGLEIRPKGGECQANPILVKWTDLSSTLKVKLI